MVGSLGWHVWRSGAVPLDWQTRVMVPIFKKVCSNYREITLLSFPGEVYAEVPERKVLHPYSHLWSRAVG